jgi:hypothetical protein
MQCCWSGEPPDTTEHLLTPFETCKLYVGKESVVTRYQTKGYGLQMVYTFRSFLPVASTVKCIGSYYFQMYYQPSLKLPAVNYS